MGQAARAEEIIPIEEEFIIGDMTPEIDRRELHRIGRAANLTIKQHQVYERLVAGQQQTQIARELAITDRAVRYQVKAIRARIIHIIKVDEHIQSIGWVDVYIAEINRICKARPTTRDAGRGKTKSILGLERKKAEW